MKKLFFIILNFSVLYGFGQVYELEIDTIYWYSTDHIGVYEGDGIPYNQYPTATNLYITGDFYPGETLTAHYTFYDKDGDLENTDVIPEVPSSQEDLTEYTAVDPETDYTVTADKLTVTDIHPEHTTTYLYYDFGEGYFKRNFEIRFALKVTDIWEEHALMGIIGVGRTVSFNVEGPRVRLNYDYQDAGSGANYVLGVGGGDHVAHGNQNQFLVGTTYYIKLNRIYVGGEEDNYVLATAYTDEDYTIRAKILYGGNIGEDILPWGDNDFSLEHATEEFRYLIIASSSRDDYSDTEYGSFEISNVEIISNED